MTNDAKFGMLAGVLGVIVAGVVSSRVPDAPPVVSKDAPKPVIAPRAALPEAPAPRTASAASTEPELQGTPVVRTRKEPTAQPASRPTAWDEEP
jgi:hypothetical protein